MMRMMKRFYDVRSLCVCLAMLALATVGVMGKDVDPVKPAPEGGAMTAIAHCQADLAQRLKVNPADAKVISTQETTWPDSALGMPEPGMMYAQALVPGWLMVLEARNTRYLYTASATTCKFGGPVALWAASMLYMQPVADEPNMNGDLYQCSLLGTNHVRIFSGVSAYYPQQKGGILVTRRTSRSSFDLLSVTAGKEAQAVTLHAAFSYGEATLNEAQDTWAALVRPRVGTDWQLVVAPVGQNDPAKQKSLPLPDGVRPQRIAYVGDQVVLMAMKGEEKTVYVYLQTEPFAEKPVWKEVSSAYFPEQGPYMLNKSESLEVTQRTENGKPVAEVARVWFTGDRTVKATINGLTVRGYKLLDMGYAFIWGETNGKPSVYTVNIDTGEVIHAADAPYQDIKPFAFPPISSPFQAIGQNNEKR